MSEGDLTRERGDIINTKNRIATELAKVLPTIGFRTPDVRPAGSVVDDAVVYVEAGNNNLISKSQVIMITIEDTDRVRLQIPSGQGNLADLLNIDDFYVVGSVGEAIARLKHIVIKAKTKDQEVELNVGSIHEMAEQDALNDDDEYLKDISNWEYYCG